MKFNEVNKEFSICNEDNNPIGLVKVEQGGEGRKLSLSLGETLTFENEKELADFVNQLLNMMGE